MRDERALPLVTADTRRRTSKPESSVRNVKLDDAALFGTRPPAYLSS